MQKVLHRGLKVWHVVVLVALLLLTGGTVALAQTEAVQGLLPAGQVRLANAYFSGDDTIDISGTGTEKIVLSTTIVIPVGKKADLQTTFSADLHPNTFQQTYAYCFGRFGLDNENPDQKFRPSDDNDSSGYQLLGGETAKEPNAVTVTMSGFRKSVSAGTHTVNVYVSSAYGGCTLFARNLNVLANIR